MKKIYFLIVCSFLFAPHVQAQSGGLAMYFVNPETQGDQYFESFAYQDALEFYQKAIEKEGENDRLRLKVAESYRKLNNPVQAGKWYGMVEAKELVFKAADLLNYAEALSSAGKYQEAKRWFSLYLEAEEADSRTIRKIEGLEKQEKLKYKNASSVKVVPAAFNTSAAEFSPAYYGKQLTFVSGRTTGSGEKNFLWDRSAFLDLYIYQKNGDSGAVKFDKNINSAYHEGPMVFWDNDTKMIFTRNNYLKKRGKSSEGVTRLKLYYSYKTDSLSWSAPVQLPFNSEEYSTGHPAISYDGTILYFASDRPGGYGGTDLYKSVFKNGSWQEPLNLGDIINTEGNELFPFLNSQGQLYFASNGHGGLGGLDIFGLDILGGGKMVVINPGAPLNSPLDDFGLIMDKEARTGYFSSNRSGGMGNDDIYSFTSEKDLLKGYMVRGQILSNVNNKPLEGTVVKLLDAQERTLEMLTTGPDGIYSFEIEVESKYQVKAEIAAYFEGTKQFISPRSEGPEWVFDIFLAEEKGYSLYALIQDEKTKEKLKGVQITLTDNMTGEPVLDKVTGEGGDFSCFLKGKKPKDRVSFQIKLAKDGYLGRTITYNAALKEPGRINLHELMKFGLDKIEIGTDIGKLLEIKPILFDVGKFVIRPDAGTELNKIAAIMKENPNIVIELGSHSDSRGSSSANLQLSEKRAKASAGYIVAQGIHPSRITGIGYGESEIINRCTDGISCSEGDHQQNRRTEFKVTKF